MAAIYYRELLNFLSRMVRDKDVAADITQESYVRLLTLEHSGEAVAEPRALLYRTARNLVIDRYRRDEVRGETAGHDGDEAPLPIESLPAPSACQPDIVAESAQGIDAMLAVIGSLPLRCREAFILHRFDGLSQAEVAGRMGISLKMVERHIKLALQACRDCRDGQSKSNTRTQGDKTADASSDNA